MLHGAACGREEGEREMFIRTKNLMLRPVFPEDWQQIYSCMGDVGAAVSLALCSEEDARAFCNSAAERGPFACAITLPEVIGAPIIGHISLTKSISEHADGALELGFWIARSHQGRGYASEAVMAMIRTAQGLGVERIAASYFIDGPACGAVLRKCGFVETGEVRPAPSIPRGGEMILARCYELDLQTASIESQSPMQAA